MEKSTYSPSRSLTNPKPSQAIQHHWVEQLALEELQLDETGVVHFNDHLRPEMYLDRESQQMMNLLRQKFQESVQLFNYHRGADQKGDHIKIFKISNTVNDFMLFRHSLRLVISRTHIDLISIAYLSPTGVYYRPRLHLFEQGSHSPFQSEGTHQLKANIGPFAKIYWKFMGENVDLDALVKHYLSEFVRNSST